VDAHIERIEALNPEFNIVVCDRFEAAREDAKRAEQQLLAGDFVGPLHGVPYTAKECIEVAGMPCTDASKLFEGNVSVQDAVVVESLNNAGAILLGKTNIPEFALHYDSNNSVYGATLNPHDRTRTPGGSSGGEAAALVTGMTPFGVGSDYGGSIRLPSSYCGSVGLKVGRFVVPRHGHFPVAQPMSIQLWSVIGPMARYIDDLEMLLPIFAQPDQVRDPDVRARTFESAAVDGAQVAVYWDNGILPVDDTVREAVVAAGRALADAGHEVVEQAPPMQQEARDIFLTAARGETGSALAPLIGERREELSPQMQQIFTDMIDELDIDMASFVGAQVFEAEIERQAAAWQVEHPIAIAPISPTPAFESGADYVTLSDGSSHSTVELMSYCTYVNQLGLPAVAVPIARSPEGLPIGVQVIGRRDCEMEVLAIAKKLEQAFGGWMEPKGLAATA